ncbi:Reducing polyketide synthase FUB1 [Hypsizygus marmoreus]|uniref:Reducing polyketide synthase FUB1 n=1 Tax=Hypsizygus marmoreus TaxID=39966 RepID=A0A369K4L0_HYPMA|nr:Reducing polyketide synthase FUB1 [Hypsizygus marmoreus]
MFEVGDTTPIAIVGIAAELPSGHYSDKNLDHKTFFQFLLDRGESYQEIPLERLNIDSWYGHGAAKISTKFGSFLKNVSMFDHVEFGVTSKDARGMALSTRKLLELSFLALLDSGIDYRGRNVGCYMSGIAFDILTIADPDEYEARGVFSGGACQIANRVSYHLDLLGPSIPTDTACSSSLTAMHLAIQAVRNGECEAAVIGGCQLNHRLVDFVQYSQGSILSKDGKCKPFDASADGFSRGEGVAAVVVKPLKDAIRDGDHIYACVLGSAINTCGAAAPVSAPVAAAQADAMRKAFKQAGRNPSDVDFVELHATGTAVGDPTEANWVGANFKREDELLIGSVKGNIGHLEIAAFLASLSKMCAMFKTGIIPPTMNLKTLNPAIHWEQYRLRAPVEAMQFKARNSSGRHLVSLASSGIGGANGHIVIEGPPPPQRPAPVLTPSDVPVLLIASGLSPRSASAVAATFDELVSAHPGDLRKLSATYGRRARQMTWRSFSIVSHDKALSTFSQPSLRTRNRPPLVFLFTGQGPQHIDMGRQLFELYPSFRDTICELDLVYKNVVGHSLVSSIGLFDKSTNEKMDVWPIKVTLPALTMIQIAIFDLLKSLGVSPDVVLGHSAGETAMLHASGAGSKEMALEIAIARGIAMSLAEEVGGTMAALACSAKDAQEIIDAVTGGAHLGKLEIACYNSHEAVALAGLVEYVDRAVAFAQSRGIFARKIRTQTPVHSSLMEICRHKYTALIEDVFLRYPGSHIPAITTFSTFTGYLFEESFTADYFWNNTRQPVLFTDVVENLLEQMPDATVIEISPHPALGSYLVALGMNPKSVLCPMRRPKTPHPFHEQTVLLEALGNLVCLGHNCVDFIRLNNFPDMDIDLPLPAYPFQPKSVPYYPNDSAMIVRQMSNRNGPLNFEGLKVNSETQPELGQHIIRGEPIMPAAGFIEMAFEFGARVLWNINFRSMLSLSGSRPIPLEVQANGAYWSVKSTAVNHLETARSGKPSQRLHADGYLSLERALDASETLDLDSIKERCQPFNVDGFYESLKYFADYGPVYRRVISCYKGNDEVLVEVKGAASDLPDVQDYVIHPAILDSCLHVMVHNAFTANADRNVYYLPSRVGHIIVHDLLARGPFPAVVFGHCVFRQWSPDELLFDYNLTNVHGSMLCSMTGFVVEKHRVTILPSIHNRYTIIHQPLNLEVKEILKPNGHSIDYQSGNPKHFYGNGSSIHADTPTDHATNLVKTLDVHIELQGTSLDAMGHRPVEAFDRLLSLIAHTSRKKAIRILQLGGERLVDSVLAIITQHPSLSVEYTVCGCMNENVPIAATISTRMLLEDVDTLAKRQTLRPASIDVFLGLDGALMTDLQKTLGNIRSLLVPGGRIILDNTKDIAAHLPAESIFEGLLIETGLAHIQSDTFPPGDSDASYIEAAKPEQAAHGVSTSTELVDGAQLTAIDFVRGEEMSIQDFLSQLDQSRRTTIWIHAPDNVDGAAARGFSRCLRREMFFLDIHLVLFHPRWDASARLSILQSIGKTSGVEEELYVEEDGQIYMPRIVPVAAQSFGKAFSPTEYWTLEGANLVQPALPKVIPHHALVQVKGSSSNADIRGIFGRVIDGGSTTFLNDTTVIGIVESSLSNFALVHEDHMIATALPEEDCLYLASAALGAIVVSFAFGSNFVDHLPRLVGRQILVTDVDTPIGTSLVQFLSALRLKVTAAPSKLLPSDIENIADSDYILSGIVDLVDLQLLKSTSPRHLFLWNDPQCGLHQMMQTRPWVIRDGLRAALAALRTSDCTVRSNSPQDLISAVPGATIVTIGSQLFDPNKTYLLVGGVGSLGCKIALWMYEKGARSLVLTSRSGKKSLTKTNNIPALRVLTYLESLSDLSLRVESCDASSLPAMQALCSTIRGPLGGCMLLAVVLSDRTFMTQTAEAFELPFVSKVDTFYTLQNSISIEKLDFLISFDTISTFGNIGQTNYASANTIVEEFTKEHSNAISLITPIIIDSSIAVDENWSLQTNVQHLTAWGTTSERLCDYIEDALLMLSKGPCPLYIPDIDWDLVEHHLGPSTLYDHLVKRSRTSLVTDPQDGGMSLMDMVLQFLDVPRDEFSPEVPLTVYGLDSLIAGRLAYALQPIVSVTQLQLLGDLCLRDLQTRIDEIKEQKE